LKRYGGARFLKPVFSAMLKTGLVFINGADNDGVAKSPPYGVTAFFQDLDILDVCLHP
jgi:hypothetical protein